MCLFLLKTQIGATILEVIKHLEKVDSCISVTKTFCSRYPKTILCNRKSCKSKGSVREGLGKEKERGNDIIIISKYKIFKKWINNYSQMETTIASDEGML